MPKEKSWEFGAKPPIVKTASQTLIQVYDLVFFNDPRNGVINGMENGLIDWKDPFTD